MNKFENKLILVIDDNPMNVLLACRTVENFGFRTISAESGALGIASLENEIPSLILMDIMMPEMDGYEACREIKKVDKWKEIPIIFLTANVHTENLLEGFAAGGVDYITKPFKGEELNVRIENHIELAESRSTILEMNRSRDKLYSIIAHDVRSPLSGILQTLDAIDQGYINPNSEDFKEIIHQLKNRTKDTSTLLSSLLEWTRAQDPTKTILQKQTNIQLLINNCAHLLEANAQNKGISISISIDDKIEAFCDEVTIHTVFRNLISNAIKFTQNNGTISIEGKQSEDKVSIKVQDSGIGMSTEAIENIFEKNQHFTSTGTANESGTGLGLMLVKDFVRMNKGSIRVESTIGVGTTFTLELPVYKPL